MTGQGLAEAVFRVAGMDPFLCPNPSSGPAKEGYCRRSMFVSDLRHFLDLPDDVPGPARRMADHLGSVVLAATAAEAGSPWESALRCQRRPGRRACPGHIAVFRADIPAAIEWRCTACGDEGVISGWEDSCFDLRDPRPVPDDDAQVDIVVRRRGGYGTSGLELPRLRL